MRPPVVMFPKSLSSHGPVPPVGVAYIAAVLRDGGHLVQVIDSPAEAMDDHEDFETPVGTLTRVGLTPAQVVERIHPDTDVIGVSHMFLHEWRQVREIVELARARFPDVPIVVGGENANAYWPWMFEQTDAIDYVVLGEGEVTAVALVDQLVDGVPVEPMPGLVIRDHRSGTVSESGGLPTRLRRLEEVPRPAWELFPLEHYFEHADYFGVERGRSMPVMATRGCPYKCSFCSSPQMWTTRYVVRDPDDLADEIAGYVEHYGVENVDFADLTAITKRQWTLRFCDALEARDLDITWQLPVGTRAEALDAEVLQRLWDTGCRNVTYAPESGSERMLEIFDKKVKLPHIVESLKAARRIGLRTHVNLIIGHPEERWSDLWKTLRFFVKAAFIGTDTGSAIMFCPYPGSADFERLRAEGVIEVDEAFEYVALSRGSSAHRSYNPQISSRQLRMVQLGMMMIFYGLGFLLHPRRVLTFLRNMRRGEEETHIDQFVRIKREERRSARSRPAADEREPVAAVS